MELSEFKAELRDSLSRPGEWKRKNYLEGRKMAYKCVHRKTGIRVDRRSGSVYFYNSEGSKRVIDRLDEADLKVLKTGILAGERDEGKEDLKRFLINFSGFRQERT